MKFQWNRGRSPGPWKRDDGLGSGRPAPGTPEDKASYLWRRDGPYVSEIIRENGKFIWYLWFVDEDDTTELLGPTYTNKAIYTWEEAEEIAILHIVEAWLQYEVLAESWPEPPEELRDLIDAHRIMKR